MESSYAQPTLSLEKKLSQQTWKKRVLLVIAPSQTDEQLRRQQDILHKDTAGLQDRELEIIYLPMDKITREDKEYLAATFNVEQPAYYSILIGKDGGEKLRSSTPMDTGKLFGTIDAMPMRKQEMKQK